MMEWRQEKGGWNGTVSNLYLGNFKVATVEYDATLNKNDPKSYACISHLPGQRRVLEHKGSDIEGRIRCELAVARWIKGAGLLVDNTFQPAKTEE